MIAGIHAGNGALAALVEWTAQLVQFMQQPISGASDHHLAGWASWHGRAMVLAWGIMLPVGVLIARFYKVTPRQDWPLVLDNKRWWYLHLQLQGGGVLVMTLGLLIALAGTAGLAPWRNLHSVFGWSIVLLAWLQLLGGWLRGSKGGPAAGAPRAQWSGDHYDMSPRRLRFERLHKGLGYLMLALSALTIFLGLASADAPVWMWLAQAAWSLLYLALFAWLQRRGRCIDTYQAIWGPDRAHPGNRIEAIGCGIRRYTAASYRRRLMGGPPRRGDGGN